MTWINNTDYWGTWVWDAGVYLGPYGTNVTLNPPSFPLPPETGEVYLSVAPTPESLGRDPASYSFQYNLTSYADVSGYVEDDIGRAQESDHLYVIWYHNSYGSVPQPTWDPHTLYTAEQASGGTGGGGVAPTPESTNTTARQSMEQNYTVVLAPAEPRQEAVRPFKLSTGGSLWWTYVVQVNTGSSSDPSVLPSRAAGISNISVSGGATVSLWPRPMFVSTYAEFDPLVTGPPSHGPATSIALDTPIDPTSWIVRVTVPPGGEGILTFLAPTVILGDRRILYYSDWYDPAFHNSTDPNDPFYGQDGYVKFGAGAGAVATSPPSGVNLWKNGRDITYDYINNTQSDVINQPYKDNAASVLLQYRYAQSPGAARVWQEQQGGIHFCSRPILDWWELKKTDAAMRDILSPYPLEHGNLAKPWAKPLPTEPVIPEPWVPGQSSWQVEWDYSTVALQDLIHFRVTEEGYSQTNAPEAQVHYHRNIGKGGNTTVDTGSYPQHGEANALNYSETHPGPQFEIGRVNDFVGTFAEIDNTQVSFAPDKHGPYMDYVYPDNLLIGQGIGWNITSSYGTWTWVKSGRYRYVRLYIGPGDALVRKTEIPMRQRHRNDGLATDAREFKGFGSSQQISIRRGGRTYY